MFKLHIRLLIFLTLLTLSINGQASCEDSYQKYLKTAPFSPLTSAISSTAYVGYGGISSTSGALASTTKWSTQYSTAGALYSAAFAYEGQNLLAGAWNKIKFYHSRRHVLKLIEDSYSGMGETLEEFYEEFNEQRDSDLPPVSVEDIAQVIVYGDENNLFCLNPKELFALNNVLKFVQDFK
jgi:hypothetical protein